MSEFDDIRTGGAASLSLFALLVVICALEVCGVIYIAASMIRDSSLRGLGWFSLVGLVVVLVITGYAAADELRNLKK